MSETIDRGNPLLVVDVQEGFLNEYTSYVPGRIVQLIERESPDLMLFTRFINTPDGPYPRFLQWDACQGPPETNIAPELKPYASEDRIFAKPGFAGIPDELKDYLLEKRCEGVTLVGIDTDMCVLKIALDIFDVNIKPTVLVDCCASTAGLQSHLAGLAVLARNIGAENLRNAGLSESYLGAPPKAKKASHAK